MNEIMFCCKFKNNRLWFSKLTLKKLMIRWGGIFLMMLCVRWGLETDGEDGFMGDYPLPGDWFWSIVLPRKNSNFSEAWDKVILFHHSFFLSWSWRASVWRSKELLFVVYFMVLLLIPPLGFVYLIFFMWMMLFSWGNWRTWISKILFACFIVSF